VKDPDKPLDNLVLVVLAWLYLFVCTDCRQSQRVNRLEERVRSLEATHDAPEAG
jgi:hypothetical protein